MDINHTVLYWKTRKAKRSKDDYVTKYIRSLDQYQGKKLKFVITSDSDHSELASNKPLVKATTNVKSLPILVESGLEQNMTDENLFKEIKAKNKNIKLFQRKGKLICAYGFSKIGIT